MARCRKGLTTLVPGRGRWFSRAGAVVLMFAGLWVPARAAAQEPSRPAGPSTLLGRIVAGDTGEPLEGVVVEAWWAADSTRLAQSASGANGRFLIGRLPEGDYYLRLDRLGYATVTTEAFELAYGETRDLGTLALPVEALELAPITVSAERTAVTFEADRTSYNVGVMGGTEGASVMEALRGIPELQVDIDGRVTLRGATPVIYIDGRPAPMTGEALALFLEQFPADYIEKIELMENPSARYSAEGSGGILNIVLKEGVELGLSGSVHVNGGTRGQYGGGVRGTLQRGPWTLNGAGFFRLTDVERTSFDLRQNLLTDPAYLRQDAWTDRTGQSGSVSLQTRYEPTERMRFYVSGRMSRSGRDASGSTTTTHLDDGQAPILTYDRATTSDASGLSGDVSAGFDYRWEPRRHELEVEARIRRGRDLEDGREEITSDVLQDGVLIPAELTLDDQAERGRERLLKVDYTRPWGEDGRLEVGFATGYDVADRDRLIRFIEDPQAAPDGTLSDRGYEHSELVSSAYMTLGRQLGPVGLQAGLRAERTDTRLAIPTGEEFRSDYLNLFPSARASYRLSDNRQLRLSYSRRLQRPSASMLNPVNRSTDPLTRRVGNPYVEPQLTHSVSLDASQSGSKGNIRLSTYYRRTTNDWAETITVDSSGVSTRTYQNLASQASYGLSLTYSLRPVEGWNGFVSVSGRRVVRDASNLDPRYSGNSFRWSSRARIDAMLGAGVSAQANFAYQPPVDLPQGRSDATYAADFGLRYRFLEERASLRLSFRDPFELRRAGERTQDISYIQIGRSRESTRNVDISLSYSFGGGGRRRGGRWR